MSWCICTRRVSPIASACIGRQPLIRIYELHVVPDRAGSARHFSVNSNGLLADAGHKSSYDFLYEYQKSFIPGQSNKMILGDYKSHRKHIGQTITAQGFLGKRKDISGKLSFVKLALPHRYDSEVQVVSRLADSPVSEIVATDEGVHKSLKKIRPHSAVSVRAVLERKRLPNGEDANMDDSESFSLKNIELVLQDITCLGAFPDDIIVSDNSKFGPGSRHLQIRFDPDLQRRLRFRHRILRQCRNHLTDFLEIETPILFKSTPEGAREFLVPTRTPGYAYALPQSPQQYKQILMASGIYKYFQIAKCFRDEDLRADRQPEFTQVDLEMAFSRGTQVMRRIERFIFSLFVNNPEQGLAIPKLPFPRTTYHEAMHKYGSDKPDLRIPDEIQQVDEILPRDLVDMLTSLSNPVIDCWRFRLKLDPPAARAFVKEFMDSPQATHSLQNPDGAPGIFIYDPRQPLHGLQAFGYEGAEALKALYMRTNTLSVGGPVSAASESSPSGAEPSASAFESASDRSAIEPFDEGDIIVLQARPRSRLSGGSTALGRLRTAIYRAAVSKGLIYQGKKDCFFLWVTDFPLFTPNDGTDPGQGGSAGFSATHHPFTAPKTAADVELLLTDPLAAIADHYDLVVNGVELGGGSKRIHNSEMQQFVMREVLKMSDERMKDFSHLFEALRAGCPPHAGIALGLDRLIAVMLGVDSVRDVIAFPKSGKGEDLLVKSPSRMTRKQLETYHLRVIEKDVV